MVLALFLIHWFSQPHVWIEQVSWKLKYCNFLSDLHKVTKVVSRFIGGDDKWAA